MGGKKITYEDVLLMELLTNWEKSGEKTNRNRNIQGIWRSSKYMTSKSGVCKDKNAFNIFKN